VAGELELHVPADPAQHVLVRVRMDQGRDIDMDRLRQLEIAKDVALRLLQEGDEAGEIGLDAGVKGGAALGEWHLAIPIRVNAV
jgi:hypothetical protein